MHTSFYFSQYPLSRAIDFLAPNPPTNKIVQSFLALVLLSQSHHPFRNPGNPGFRQFGQAFLQVANFDLPILASVQVSVLSSSHQRHLQNHPYSPAQICKVLAVEDSGAN